MLKIRFIVIQCDQIFNSKVAQFFPQFPKGSHKSVHLKSDVFQTNQKVAKYLGYFCKTICCQKLIKKNRPIWSHCCHNTRITWSIKSDTREVVVAQLVERSLPIPEVRGLNPVISKNLLISNICILSTVN